MECTGSGRTLQNIMRRKRYRRGSYFVRQHMCTPNGQPHVHAHVHALAQIEFTCQIRCCHEHYEALCSGKYSIESLYTVTYLRLTRFRGCLLEQERDRNGAKRSISDLLDLPSNFPDANAEDLRCELFAPPHFR
eukprot:9481915-Pyramimonas_sp.AAC.1